MDMNIVSPFFDSRCRCASVLQLLLPVFNKQNFVNRGCHVLVQQTNDSTADCKFNDVYQVIRQVLLQF